MVLNEKVRVAADATILEALQLTVDESLLTGESVPVTKSLQKESGENSNVIFSGTLVVKGRGLASVDSTGVNTQFGKIGSSLEKITPEEEARLQKELKVLIRYLFLSVQSLIIGIVTLSGRESLFNPCSTDLLPPWLFCRRSSGSPHESMALGAWHLSKKNVLTRNPSAIRTLIAGSVLCTDKTGTITPIRWKWQRYIREKISYRQDFDAGKNRSSLPSRISLKWPRRKAVPRRRKPPR